MNIYIARDIPESGRDLVSGNVRQWKEADNPVPRDVLLSEVETIDGLLCLLTDRIDDELLARAPKLKVVSNMAVGYDNIDIDACTSRKVAVTNTPGVLTESTADLAFALLLAVSRRIPEAETVVRTGNWTSWSPLFMAGRDVYGTTLGIIGMGRIGTAVARRASGFDMNVIYYDEHTPHTDLGKKVDLDTLLKTADFISIHVPLTEKTRDLIGAAELRKMKKTAYIINTARGSIINEPALISALNTGDIAGAALDVMATEPLPEDDPLLQAPNLVVVPHIGSATIETRTAMAELAATNLMAVMNGEKPQYLVNPDVWPECLGRGN